MSSVTTAGGFQHDAALHALHQPGKHAGQQLLLVYAGHPSHRNHPGAFASPYRTRLFSGPLPWLTWWHLNRCSRATDAMASGLVSVGVQLIDC